MLLILMELFKLLPEDMDMHTSFLSTLLYTYKCIQLVNYASACVDDTSNRHFDQPFCMALLDFAFYASYMPYTGLLIVLYDDFYKQLAESRGKSAHSWGAIFAKSVRVLFAAALLECLLSFTAVASIASSTEAAEQLDYVTLCCVVYIMGQMFHVKYVVMFGFPALFASVDNMKPEKGPICISRVTCYARMWRHFDRGLYQFLKKHVYLPLVAPSFSFGRKLAATLMAYGFVLVWHGTSGRIARWVTLNGIEVMLEMAMSALYQWHGYRTWLDANLSPKNQRRLGALFQDVFVSLGIFGCFHFVCEHKVGMVVAHKTFYTFGIKLARPFWHLIFLGYCFNNVNMALDQWETFKWKWDKCPFLFKIEDAADNMQVEKVKDE